MGIMEELQNLLALGDGNGILAKPRTTRFTPILPLRHYQVATVSLSTEVSSE